MFYEIYLQVYGFRMHDNIAPHRTNLLFFESCISKLQFQVESRKVFLTKCFPLHSPNLCCSLEFGHFFTTIYLCSLKSPEIATMAPSAGLSVGVSSNLIPFVYTSCPTCVPSLRTTCHGTLSLKFLSFAGLLAPGLFSKNISNP